MAVPMNNLPNPDLIYDLFGGIFKRHIAIGWRKSGFNLLRN